MLDKQQTRPLARTTLGPLLEVLQIGAMYFGTGTDEPPRAACSTPSSTGAAT